MGSAALAFWLSVAGPWATAAALAPTGTVQAQDQGQATSFTERLAAQVDPQSVRVQAVQGGARLRCDLQDITGTVTPAGLSIESVSDTEGGGVFTLRLSGWGRLGSMLQPSAGQVTADGNRVTNTRRVPSGSVEGATHPDVSGGVSEARSSAFRRFPRPPATRTPDRANAALQTLPPAVLIEEFTTSGDGIRHDLFVLTPPSGSGELLVTLALTGAEAVASATGVTVRLPAGRELTYNQLSVTDATGRRLPARMEIVAPASSPIRVDTEDAAPHAPVTPDAQKAGTTASAAPSGARPAPSRSCPSTPGTPPSTLLFVHVDDANARYPVRIDPTISDANWRSLGGWPGADKRVRAVAITGAGDLVVGGDFAAIGDVVANGIALWNGSGWATLESGVNGTVSALAVAGTDLYAGGDFTTAGGDNASCIAKWNGSSWSALGSGVNGAVRTLVVSDSDLYAGGQFTRAGGAGASYIAKWNVGSSSWLPLGSGMNGAVNALTVDSDGNVYAGGGFTTAGGFSANYIAKWNGSNWWPLGLGVNGTVNALAMSGTALYVGGGFTTAGGFSANYIAKCYVGSSSWAALVSGVNNGVNGYVNALAVSESGLVYAGGSFTTAGGVSANNLAKWNGSSSWAALGSGGSNGVNGTVSAVAVSGSDLVAGGQFTTAGGGSASYVAAWNGSTGGWAALSTGVGADDAVSALVVVGTDLYAGGKFTTAGGVAVNRIARWNGSTWTALGAGVNGAVNALAVSDSGLYAGGQFTTAGGVNANRVAKWNGSWTALGSGMNGTVNALAVSDSGLYAGGQFTTAGGVTVNYIARWNGSSWWPLGLGVNGAVNALALSSSYLYAGGQFTTADGFNASRIAKWNGSYWTALGSGMNGSVKVLAGSSSYLYAGGQFTIAGGFDANYVARWNGNSWAALGPGMNGSVNALAVSGTDLYAGGEFTTAGGGIASRVASWDGNSWAALGQGVNGVVNALAASGTDLYVGGEFTTAGDKASPYAAAWLTLAPTPTLTTTVPEPTSTSPIPITVTFSESVTGFSLSDVSVTNGTPGTFAGSDASYSLTVTPTAQGAVTVSISSGVCTGTVTGKPNNAATPLSRTYDSVRPTVANVSSTTADGTYAPDAVIAITVTFSEPVTVTGTPQLTLETGTTDTGVDCTGGSGTATLTFQYTVAAGHANAHLDYVGTTALVLNDGTIRDAAGNNATLTLPAPGAAQSLGANTALVIDGTGPTVTLASTAPEPTHVSPIPVTVTFSEVPTGFTSDDITVTNGTAANFSGSGVSYSLNVTPTGQGPVTVNIAAGVCTDAVGNGNSEAVPLSRTYDTQGPTPTLASTAPAATRVTPIPVTVTFSETVTGFTYSDITVTNGTWGAITGSGANYSFNVTPSGPGAVTVNIAAGVCADAAGNANLAATPLSRTYDVTPPTVTVTLTSGQPDPVEVAPVQFTVVFNEGVVDFALGDVTVGGTAQPVRAGVTATAPLSGTTYQVAVSGMTQSGTVSVSVQAGVAHDAAGNANLASNQVSTAYVRHPADTQLDLVSGWNLIALPIEPDAPELDDVFAQSGGRSGGGSATREGARGGVYTGAVWGWVPGDPAGRLQRVTEVHALAGYWVYAEQAVSNLTVTGTTPAHDRALAQGWNLVGAATTMTAPQTNPALQGQWWRWNAAAQYYEAVPDGGDLVPGSGYWILATEALTLPLGP